MINPMNILKKAKCGTLSNPSKKTLIFNVGHDGEQIHLRIAENSGGGFFSSEWVGLSSIAEQVTTDEPFTTSILTPLYESKSSNNPGFLAAVLVAEKLWLPVMGNRRQFTQGDVTAFTKRMQVLIGKKVNLKDEVAEREAKKEAARIALEKKLQAQRAKTAKAKPATPKAKS